MKDAMEKIPESIKKKLDEEVVWQEYGHNSHICIDKDDMLEVEKKIFRDEENAEKILKNISLEIDKNLKLKNIVNSKVL